ncbi:helix-turn-helix transcriptional regulator [Pseudomonas matsuisoli]|uniref:Transcriptional regulator n=1 Tax=Pseudomonas matsuisoli TaxID=1515666 RepID=A0A917V0V1_9PSED|nr:YafY family protein [Pseudomonas matsuisoli]GGK06369.1 transcriptional regulator [Pseudomonas matsuisoli]
MTRTERLLKLLQILRGHRLPVSGQVLASDLGVSLRTLYRDIATLQGQGADIQGEPGFGYVLKPGYLLPTLMFTSEELEALLLGLRWVERRTDPALSVAAQSVQGKLRSVLGAQALEHLEKTPLFAGPGSIAVDEGATAQSLREAIRDEHKVVIDYVDERKSLTQRTVRPVALGYFDGFQVLAAWCDLRGGFRHFRLERINRCVRSTERFTGQGGWLLAQWHAYNKTRGIVALPTG